MKATVCVVLIAIFIATVAATNFDEYVKKYNKETNDPNVRAQRKKNFEENAKNIENANKNVQSTYKQGVNDAADMSEKERDARRGLVQDKSVKATPFGKSVRGPVPTSLDLRPKMSPVKNQGSCGSCFIFSTMAVLEYWALKNKTAVKILSDQNVLDCDKNGSCDGGHPAYVLMYARDQGISDGTKYVYKGVKNSKCLRTKTLYPPVFKLPRPCGGELDGDEDILKEIITAFGPVVIVIHTKMDGNAFDFYKSGIFDASEEACSPEPEEADHGMTAVGFGVDKNKPFFILRNSWGPTWGEKGYMRIAAGKNCCGFANFAFGSC